MPLPSAPSLILVPSADVSVKAPPTDASSSSVPPLVSPESPKPADASLPDQVEVLKSAAVAPPPFLLDPAVAALCVPISEADPCGPDLDSEGDEDYLNFFAAAEGVLPTSFFSLEDGKPFDRALIDLSGQIEAINPLLVRTRDLRLLITRARLFILNRDLCGFAVTLAAVAEWLDKFWDAVHPRPQGGDLQRRVAALATLDLPTVVFPLQYAPFFEARRIGPVTYRAWMIAAGEVQPRSGEQKHLTGALTQAIAEADPAVLAAARKDVALLKASLGRIRNAFALRGSSPGLESLPALVEKLSVFIDPLASARDQATPEVEESNKDGVSLRPAGAAPASLSQARAALTAVADYYSRLEPSSPTLPLVRQAHQLIGKSFIEAISILVPTQMEKAAFQIGGEQVFDLPVGRLSKLTEGAPAAPIPSGVGGAGPPSSGIQMAGNDSAEYDVQSRSQALVLLEQVQRFFRAAEPSSPVPMLCERARALAERDFMGVLRDVLPKAALRDPSSDK